MKQRSAFRFGRFELRPADHVLLEDGTPVRLTPKAFDTLAALVRRRGTLVSRDELMREVWPDTFVEEGGLTQNISVLRKLLNQPGQPELIETISRRGYRFAGIVEERPAGRDEEARLAVLPFVVASAADAGLVDIADGLAADLIDSLTAIGPVRVTAFSTVARYRGREADPLRAARDLRVDLIVAGRLRRSHSSVSFDVELVDGDDGSRLWAHRFECELAALESLPREAARLIGRTIGVVPAANAGPDSLRRDAGHSDAYMEYLEGRHHLAHRTIERVERAIQKFERAIERDGGYAPAYAGLADAHTLAASAEYGGGRWAASMARAKSAATRALALDDGLAQAHASLALVHFRLDWNWALAEQEFRRALALNPRDADLHHAFAFYLIAMERRDEACAEMAEASRLQPVSLIIGTGLGRILHFAGQNNRAIDQFERVRDLEPSFAQAHFDLSFAYAEQGRLEQAIDSCRTAIALAPGRPVCSGVLGNYLARAGHVEEARAALGELEGLVDARQASPFDLALVHTGLGDVERAIDALAAACRERHGLLVYLRVEPLWNPLRRDRRFDHLLREVGLVQRF
jgi:serine/threonine-protein kinase